VGGTNRGCPTTESESVVSYLDNAPILCSSVFINSMLRQFTDNDWIANFVSYSIFEWGSRCTRMGNAYFPYIIKLTKMIKFDLRTVNVSLELNILNTDKIIHSVSRCSCKFNSILT